MRANCATGWGRRGAPESPRNTDRADVSRAGKGGASDLGLARPFSTERPDFVDRAAAGAYLEHVTRRSSHNAQRRDRLIQELDHDPYRSKRKPPEPTVCPGCQVVFQSGHWQWAQPPGDAHQGSCPACRRARDRYPAGTVRLEGTFLHGHSTEIAHLVRNIEAREKGQRPLNRIMEIEQDDDGWTVHTTDLHLARAIGEALESAYSGDLDYHYVEESALVRVFWRRDM